MTQQDIEAELSYAYLHAVASKAGVACQYCSRTFDSAGVDAQLKVTRDFGPGSLTDLTVEVQLKATTRQPVEGEGRFSYFLADIGRYNRLRAETIVPPRLLVVLFLPEDAGEWLRHTCEQLVMQRCAFWVSLKGAPESANETGQTIYMPADQPFSPEGLTSMLARLAREQDLRYVP